MLAAKLNRFEWTLSSTSVGVTPANRLGTNMTSGAANTMGSTVSLMSGATVANDVYGILINLNSLAVAATALDSLCDVMVDPAGGTSWSATPLISALQAGPAGWDVSFTNSMNTIGAWYYFPLFIKSGTSIGARFQSNAATQTMAIWIMVFGRPSRPDMIRVGAYVDTIGTTAASSRGTLVTPGTSAEGTWTAIGSTTAKPYWWTQLGLGVNDSTMTDQAQLWDFGVGDATNKDLIFENRTVSTGANEVLGQQPAFMNCYREIPSGVQYYVRGHAGGTPDSNWSASVYGLGG